MKQNFSIVCLDDDLDILKMQDAYLTNNGFDVQCFVDPRMALTQIQDGSLKCDLIITDYQMPEISGLDVVEKIKSSNLNIPVIIMTVDTQVETAIKLIEAGAADFVLKPIHYPQLLISIERARRLSHVNTENQVLRSIVTAQKIDPTSEIVGRSPKFVRVLELARKIANSTTSVFIHGESGSGKEIIAHFIHKNSDRRDKPFIPINCSAIPENLLESELFGHAKGAFTGATDKKVGLFEEASGGTLLLDEIGDLSAPLQAKLLRVIQERRIRRIGENQFRKIDVRLISATHKDLRVEMEAGRFREDLFFRLNVVPIYIPPLRERKEDILPLAEFFLRRFSAINGVKRTGFSKDVIKLLLTSPWKGNIRELQNTIERAVVIGNTPIVEMADLVMEDQSLETRPSGDKQLNVSFPENEIVPLETIEKYYITHALKVNNGARDKTAKQLGIDRKTLYRRLHDMDVH